MRVAKGPETPEKQNFDEAEVPNLQCPVSSALADLLAALTRHVLGTLERTFNCAVREGITA